MHANVSAIKCFQNNPMEWHYRYGLRRIPVGVPAVYFSVGSWHHSVMEAHSHGLRDAALADFAASLLTKYVISARQDGASNEYIDRLEDDCTRLMALIPFIPERFKIDNLHYTETVFQAPLDAYAPTSHTFFGRPDAVVEMLGKFFHVQYKSLSDRTPMKVYTEVRAMDLHELMYAYLICTHFEIPLSSYGGTYLNVTRKISTKAIKERPLEAFVQEIIPISEAHVISAISDVIPIMDEMALIQNGMKKPLLNREALTNRYGNVLSDYFYAFRGDVSIHDDMFFKTRPADEGNEAIEPSSD